MVRKTSPTTLHSTSILNNTIIKMNTEICKGLNESAQKIHQNNKEKGFWDNDRNVGELLMLVTSELGEAMEAHRKGRFADIEKYEQETSDSRCSDKDVPHIFKARIKDSFEDEICDAIIRLLDMSAGLGIDIEKHIQYKVQYNTTREKLHGKQY